MDSSKASRSMSVLGLATPIIAVVLVAGLWRNDECPANNPMTSLSVKGVHLSIEVAANEASRSCGLAFRDRLPVGHGMLFVHEDERFLEFWMKDTRIPLALAYIGNDRKIREILHMAPNNDGHVYRSQQPVQYALEANPGWFVSNGIAIGDRVDFSLPDGLSVD